MIHTPRKRFGQNFLIDTQVIDAIVSAINPKPTEHFLEIGPGSGALTHGLVLSGAAVDAVEIDRDLAEFLTLKYASYKNFHLHTIDILKFSLKNLKINKHKLRVVGNLPYNISTPLLFKLFAEMENIADMIFMLQHEVAIRLIASPGNKDYGRLSVMAQYYCDMQILLDVPPHAFNPPPKVNSSIIQFMPHKKARSHVSDVKLLQNIVTQAFSQRRKTISNSLKNFLTADMLQSLHIDPKLRAENLSLEDFTTITNYITGK